MRIATISTSDTDRQSFDIWLTALYMDKREHNRAALKKIAALQELLEGFTMECAEDDEKRGYKKSQLILKAQPCEIVFEEDQFDELRRAMDAVGWIARAAKQVTAAYDLLDAAKHVTAKELAEQAA